MCHGKFNADLREGKLQQVTALPIGCVVRGYALWSNGQSLPCLAAHGYTHASSIPFISAFPPQYLLSKSPPHPTPPLPILYPIQNFFEVLYVVLYGFQG